jgi:hypothetical protein
MTYKKKKEVKLEPSIWSSKCSNSLTPWCSVFLEQHVFVHPISWFLAVTETKAHQSYSKSLAQDLFLR